MRWEIEHLFNGKLSVEYSYQKLLKSDNSTSGQIENVRDAFFRHSVVTLIYSDFFPHTRLLCSVASWQRTVGAQLPVLIFWLLENLFV